ncbi:MAG: WbqC family protein [Bacteroidota bacterium]
MKLGIMQPYFLPYIGYFSLIDHVDHFILFDTPQFIRHGWIERNRVISSQGRPMYIKVPLVKKPRDTSIAEMNINQSVNWKEKIIAQINAYKKARNFHSVKSLLLEALEYSGSSITQLNYHSLSVISNYLDIKTQISIWSDMNVEIKKANEPDEWALNITKALGADKYVNPENGLEFFSKEKFYKNNIDLQFIQSKQIPYNQGLEEFIPYLSIIDVLMHCSKEEARMRMKSVNFID